MAYKFNPFTGKLDDAGSASGGVPDPLTLNSLTVNTLLTAEHIHGNLAGSVYIHVKNTDSVQLDKGTPFYITGTVGASDRVEIQAADSADPAKGPAIGVVEDDLAVNGEGNGVIIGEIYQYDTSTPGWAVNDSLYVANGGGLTNIQPASGYSQIVGYAGRIHASTGTIILTGTNVDPVAGSNTQIQFNDAGSFGGDADLTWNKTTNVLGVTGDVNLSDGGTYTTTLQTITPTANRTVSIPDATGTLALVAGSSGQPVYNNAGAYAGLSTATIGATGNITLSLNGAASTPPVTFTGSWYTGGTATTTKPQVLIEPTGTTSTAWSTSGTGLGVNAASGFSGNLLDLQVNGSQKIFGTSNGYLYTSPGNGSTNAHGLGFIGRGCGISAPSTHTLRIGRDNSADIYIGVSIADQYINLRSACRFGWASAGADGLQDLSLFRDASDTLAQRRGTNAQTYRLYNTYTDASNYERGFLQWNSNVLEIGSEGAGTGSEQPVRITAATLKLPNLPTYADNAAATTGGLVAGDVYQTVTGELRITV